MTKTVAIPSHITGTVAQDNYYNLVYNGGNCTGTLTKSYPDILVSDITTTKIQDVIGSSSHAVSTLCTATINENSYYKPDHSSPYNMGDFACYNPNAKPPTYYASHPAYDPDSPIEVYLEDAGGGDYKIRVDCSLRRGDLVPTHGNGASDWSNINVIFSLRTLAGGGGGTELSATTVTGVSVTSYTYNTPVVAYIYDNSGTSFDIDNEDQSYRLRITAQYANGTDETIEDGVLNYYVYASEYVPATPPSWSLNMYERPVGTLGLAPVTGSGWGTAVYNASAGAYYGELKAQFAYYIYPDGYPTVTTWYGTAVGCYIPENTTNDAMSVTTVQFVNDSGNILDIDTGTGRQTVRVYYFNGTDWINFATYTY